tara:strand:- start:2150 stop:2659 length:510 start_codon:yes stop_codon:yes gene_type:complete
MVMRAVSSSLENNNFNPLDLIEDVVVSNDWSYNRTDSDTLYVEVGGEWCDYQLTLAWSPDCHLLQYTWTYNIKIPSKKYALIYSLLNKINLNLSAGHFELWADDGWIMYRNSLISFDYSSITSEKVDYILSSSLEDCDKYYPTFQFLLWGNKTPTQAIESSLLETQGEA